MQHFVPISLNCKNKLCCIVGGGRIAERKVKGLMESGAFITVISPNITPDLQVLADHKQLHWVNRVYREGDLQGAFLVYAATDRREVNNTVAHEAVRRGILVNVADRSEDADFITPGIIRRGRLTISVSTAGAGPAVTSEITSALDTLFGSEYEPYLDFMYDMRQAIKRTISSPQQRAKLLRRLASSGILEQIRRQEFTAWTQEEMDIWIAQNQEE
ncbi:siroheme synthase [Paenibacillus sp. IHB B 3084]|uniref:precorrin-2 dehydrogenase/sirohydrochlorin ferrochelatase family protein n=1 Tax=Paenibacillus TaxID=44249 RepID=UPI00071EC6F5|nr:MULTISPECIES: NAD(P)-dependent oxidoreductase [Paenibacillus]ALP37867.1 siroheme synthase [Paenibacillus sp. IHB B 3084]MBE0338946.1 bifunctional precorrin-2 dehydrogenase/sirohydrochlorin ferrochelatase [Paenibacillus sp. 23TSA30-6]